MRLLLAALVFLTLVGTVEAQSPVQRVAIGAEGVDSFLAALRNGTGPSVEVADEVDASEPRFVFVPGILGSQLTIDNNDGSVPVDIWGGDTNLFFSPSLRITDDVITTAPLDDISFIIGHADVYGQALADLASRSIDDQMLTVYSYDWRKDNVESAARLQVWLCENRDVYEGHQVYFLTHSMGSLVVEYWFKHFRNMDCFTQADTDNSDWMDVGEIIMLGAPLYGAPAALSAFASGANLTEGQIFGSALHLVDRASAQLTEHGPTFLSMYQLLPIYREDCFDSTVTKESMLYLRATDLTTSRIDDIFSAEVWKSLGWPVRLPDYMPRDEYYETFLPQALEKARAFQCELAAYDLGAYVPTTYFYGVVDGLTTPSAIEVSRSGDTTLVQWECTAAPNNCLEQGDGTVPAFIAKNAFTTDRRASRSTSLPHMELLHSKEVAEYVSSIIADTQFAALAAAASSSGEKAQVVVNVASALGALLPMTTRDAETSEQALALNRQIITSLDVSAADVALLAARETDVRSLLQWTALLSDLPDTDQQTVFYNFNKAAILANQEGNYFDAITALDAAIATAGEMSDDNVAGALGEIYVLRGDAWANMANPDAAMGDYRAAIEAGNPAGQSGIEYLEDFSTMLPQPQTNIRF